MPERNDEAFAAYLMKMAKRVYETDQARIERWKEYESHLETISASNRQTISAANMLAQIQSMQATTNALRTITLATPSNITASTTNSVTATSHSHSIDVYPGDILEVIHFTPNDMEIIRAYFEGDDVVLTLLAQER